MKIGVAGSMQFTEQLVELAEKLEAMGHHAFTSKFAAAYVGKTDDEKEVIKLDHKYNYDAIREFWQPLQDADALLVANFDKHGISHYIGGNAFLEMGFAYVLGKKIYLLNPIPDMPFFGTEIIAMNPEVIHGDLSRIKSE